MLQRISSATTLFSGTYADDETESEEEEDKVSKTEPEGLGVVERMVDSDVWDKSARDAGVAQSSASGGGILSCWDTPSEPVVDWRELAWGRM